MLIEVTEKNNRELQIGDIIEINGNNELYIVLSLRETIGEYIIVNVRNGYDSFGIYGTLNRLEG
ncbi:TPA: hypothetical protein ACG3KP_004054, partial [Clostridioides difficile]